MLVNDYIIMIFFFPCAQVTETIYRRMQRKGSMLVNYSPLPDHALPNFFRPVSFFFSRLAKGLFPTLYHTLCPAPYNLRPTLVRKHGIHPVNTEY